MSATAKGVLLTVTVMALLGGCTGTGRPPTLLKTVAGFLYRVGPEAPGGATAHDVHARRTAACAISCGEKRDACALYCGNDTDPGACRGRCDRGNDACVTQCAGPPPID